MIRTITVYSGESDYAQAAQKHAIEAAKAFGARLKIVSLWKPENGPAAAAGEGNPAEAVTRPDRHRVAEMAKEAGVECTEDQRGTGMTRGLLEESRESDLLVLGLPPEEAADESDLAAGLIKRERPVLSQAECSLLIVRQPPEPIDRVLVHYEGDIWGKAALQRAGLAAKCYEAALSVLAVDDDTAEAAALASAAEEYLQGFNLTALDSISERSGSDLDEQVLSAAAEQDADLVVMGEAGHGLLARFLGKNATEKVALEAQVPLLIAR